MNVKGASTQSISNSEVRVNVVNSNRPSTELTRKSSSEKKEGRKEEFSHTTVDNQIDSMNELLKFNRTTLRFNKHEDLGRMYVQIVSQDTDEVVKEIPPEQFLDMVASMLEHAGLLIDKRV